MAKKRLLRTEGILAMATRAIRTIRRDPISDLAQFEAFACNVPHANPPTPDAKTPDVRVFREFRNHEIVTPDGRRIPMWIFADPQKPSSFPSEAMRFREGQLVHSTASLSVNTHTIHHHGIEPTPFNDGVGHTSFEPSGNYTYQFSTEVDGTYFYHCHKNTVLHFEMGLYGMLLIDPPEGEGFVRRANAVVPYDVEAVWAVDDIDPLWHDFHHDAGFSCPNGENAGLNDFRPEHFLISGVFSPDTREDPRVTVRARLGQTILIRLLNAGYTIQTTTFHPDVTPEIIALDGRTLGDPRHSRYSRPRQLLANQGIRLSSAQRVNLLIRPQKRGRFPVTFEYRQYVQGDLLHTAETFIEVI